MIKWKVSIILCCICNAVFGQNSARIGADIAEFAENGNMRIIISHAFTQHWSTEASASFRIAESLSENTFYKTNGHSEWELIFRYWLQKCYRGLSISLGAIQGFRQKTDMRIGAGYSIPVTRRISIDIGYGVRLLDSIRNITPEYNDIHIEVYYRF